MVQEKRVAAVIVAAGQSRRMGFDKLFCEVGGKAVWRTALDAFDSHPLVDELVLVCGENLAAFEAALEAAPAKKPVRLVPGGKTRMHSVKNGVEACENAALVAIHDAARPFVTEAVITAAVEAAAECGAAAPAVPLKDTVKEAENGKVVRTLSRGGLAAMQTPQVFLRGAYLAALGGIPQADYAAVTDDCMVMERAGKEVRLVDGSYENIKITTVEDLPDNAASDKADATSLRIGHGYDVHRFAPNRRFIVGGVDIPHPVGLLGHSDADVLLHAVTDAVLGAAALGDIGKLFPDSSDEFKDADSLVLLRRAAAAARTAGFAAVNVDATVVCQAPKLSPYIAAMRGNIAGALGIDESAVNVKATTEEGLGFTGAREGVAAHCVALLAKAR